MMPPHSPEIISLIRENSRLFWYVKPEYKESISEEVLVETILNYGDLNSVKRLFICLGIEKVAGIFHRQIHQSRVNYFRPVAHYFSLYFQKHVPGYPG
ncbi:MAG: hypothetical protein U0T82_07200 [Bacteroidales bacterium]